MTKPMTIPDMGFLYCETVERPNHVAAMQIFDIPEGKTAHYTHELFTEMLQHTGVETPFNYKVGAKLLGTLQWVEDQHVDLNYHIRHIMLPQPGSRHQLLEYVEQAHSNLLDRNRPLWEAHLISGLADNRFAVYIKMHHAFTDGAKANKIMMSYLSQDASQPLQPFWALKQFENKPRKAPTPILSSIFEASKQTRKHVSTIPSMLSLSSKMILQGAKVYKSNIPTPFTAPKAPFSVSPKRARRAATSQISLSRVKNISKISGTTINDVVVCICDIALHHYLKSIHFKLEQPLIAQIPISLRDEKDSTSNNRIAITMVELAHNTASPLVRLMEINESCNKLKKEAALLPDETLTGYSLVSQGLAMVTETLKLDSVLPPVGNVLISNVPGPRKPMYMKGAKLQECYPFSVLPPGISLNITLYSYMNDINIGLISCRSNLPQLSNLSAYIETAFIELEDAVMTSAIEIVSEQIAKLSADDHISDSMHNMIEAVNDSACDTVIIKNTVCDSKTKTKETAKAASTK